MAPQPTPGSGFSGRPSGRLSCWISWSAFWFLVHVAIFERCRTGCISVQVLEPECAKGVCPFPSSTFSVLWQFLVHGICPSMWGTKSYVWHIYWLCISLQLGDRSLLDSTSSLDFLVSEDQLEAQTWSNSSAGIKCIAKLPLEPPRW